MPVRDNLHDIVKSALIKDGWRITHDPLFIGYADVRVYVDLGAERPIAAEKEDEKIAVEVKSFVGRSAVQDFEQAIGQYVTYRGFLRVSDPERMLFLAVDDKTYESVFTKIGFHLILTETQVRIIVVQIEREEIVRWIK
jgi:hypothetical protein